MRVREVRNGKKGKKNDDQSARTANEAARAVTNQLSENALLFFFARVATPLMLS